MKVTTAVIATIVDHLADKFGMHIGRFDSHLYTLNTPDETHRPTITIWLSTGSVTMRSRAENGLNLKTTHSLENPDVIGELEDRVQQALDYRRKRTNKDVVK